MKEIYKKSEAGLTLIIIIIIILVFLGWVVNLSQRECKSNRDCSSESYCGSDFSCHTYPTIQKTVVQYNFFAPSIFIAIAIIIAAIIFNWDKIKTEKPQEEKPEEYKSEVKPTEETVEIGEPYYKSYKSDSNIKVP